MGKWGIVWSVAKKIIALSIVLFLIASIDFVVFRAIPEHGILPRTGNTEFVNRTVLEYHLDKSMSEQYLFYMWNTLTLDFGFSTTYVRGVDIANITRAPLERSLWLFGIVGALTVFAGIAYEAVASNIKTRFLRMAMRFAAIGFLSVPALGLTLLSLNIDASLNYPLPQHSMPYSSAFFGETDIWGKIFYNVSHGVLPVAVCILLTFGFVSLFFRSNVAGGLSKMSIWRGTKGVLASMNENPWSTKLFFAWIVSCVLLVDPVFNYHGLGTLLWNGLLSRDIPIAMTVFLIIAGILAVSNCIFDILAILFSPKIVLPSKMTGSRSMSSTQITSQVTPSLVLSAKSVLKEFRVSKVGMAAAIVFTAIAVSALAAPLLATVNPNAPDGFEPTHPPSWINPLPPSLDPSPYTGLRHLLGTDAIGMDIYSAMLYGSRDLVLACVVIATISFTLGVISGVAGSMIPSEKGMLTRGLSWLTHIVGDAFVAIPLILMIVGLSFDQDWGFWFVCLLVAPLVFSWAGPSVAHHVSKRVSRIDGSARRIRLQLPTIFGQALYITKLAVVIGLLTLIALNLFQIYFTPSSWGSLLEGAFEWNAIFSRAWWWYLPPVLGTCLLLTSSFVTIDTLERIIKRREYATQAPEAPSQLVTAGESPA